ncbi:MAG: hypothetical protein QF491_13080, partial [Alphaproteobacteria bacterium]|nr:hypothetical protein [Alphaproteobacteria bacterium]
NEAPERQGGQAGTNFHSLHVAILRSDRLLLKEMPLGALWMRPKKKISGAFLMALSKPASGFFVGCASRESGA